MIRVSLLLFYSCLAVGFKAMAQEPVSKADQQPYSLSLTVKLHSTGHSPFSGAYFNHHLNSEIGLAIKRKQVGAFINKNIDFEDVHSSINYTTIGLFKTFDVSNSLKLTPYIGYFFKQSYSFMDNSSDLWSCVVVRFTVNRWMTIENTALLGNLVRHRSNASLANRTNVLILIRKFKFDAYVWYTHSLSSTRHFVSSSLAITSPDWEITPSLSARVQVAMIQQISNKKPEGAMLRGGLITLIVPVLLVKNR